jgi:hypothetical protein
MNIELPDGTVLEDIPEGTTKAEILAKLRANGQSVKGLTGMGEKAEAFRFDSLKGTEPTGVERRFGGLKHAWDRIALAAKGIVTDLTPEDKELLEAGKAFVNEAGGQAKAAQIATDIAITAPLGGPAVKGAKAVVEALPVLKYFPRTGAALGGGAAVGAATDPENRAGGAVLGAAGGAVGEGIARAIGGPLKASDVAEHVMHNLKAQPTIGQGAANPMFRVVEDFAANIPFAGHRVRAGQQRALDEVNEAAIKDLHPDWPDEQVAEEVAKARKILQESPNTRRREWENTTAAVAAGVFFPKAVTAALTASTLGTKRPVSRYMLGGYDVQKRIDELIQEKLAAAGIALPLATEQ